jgi:hypothetical protein
LQLLLLRLNYQHQRPTLQRRRLQLLQTIHLLRLRLQPLLDPPPPRQRPRHHLRQQLLLLLLRQHSQLLLLRLHRCRYPLLRQHSQLLLLLRLRHYCH